MFHLIHVQVDRGVMIAVDDRLALWTWLTTTWFCIKGSDVWTAACPGDDVGLKLVHDGEREGWPWRRRDMAARRPSCFLVWGPIPRLGTNVHAS